MIELKPCPFCGSESIDAEGWLSNNGTSGPSCDDCGCTAESIEEWNNRPIESELESANADLQRRLDEATRAFGQAAKERAEALKIIEDSRKQEPSVYILPSVLRECETTEMNAHVYSVPFGCPEENSVPLYKKPVAAKERTEP